MRENFNKQTIMSICLSSSEGGLEFCVVHFAKKLQNEGHESIVVCLKNSTIEKKAKAYNLIVISLSKHNIFFRILKTIQLIKKYKPDTLISHRSLGIKISVLHKLLNPKLKLINFIHTIIRYSKNDSFHRFFYSRINKFIVFTEIQKINALEHLPIRNEQIKVIPHTVDTTLFYPSIIANFVDEDIDSTKAMTIGCVGRFDLKKGQIELIEATKLLKNRNINFKLIFIGKDTLGEEGIKKQCQELVLKYNLEKNITFYDHQAQIADYYKTFDIFVMPSYEETFGLVLIEAMASGCICVSTHAGGPIEILDHGNAGVLVKPKSVNELAIALEKIIQNPKKYNDLRSAAFNRVKEKYSDNIINFSDTLF